MIQEFYKRLHKAISSSDLTAYRYYGEEYSYRDLYRYMKRLNYYLGAHRQKRVALLGPKDIEIYAAIYSIILSGNTWIPIPAGYPAKRLLDMLQISDAEIILYSGALPQEIASYARAANIPMRGLKELIAQNEEVEFEGYDFSADDLAYIMFTSGSTGSPKGVPITHQNYINFILNAMEILPFNTGEIFSDYHDFSFDISIFYLFCAPLTESAISPIKRDEERIFPVRHFVENKVTVLSSVPSLVTRVQRVRPDEKIENSVRIAFLCGEPFGLGVLRYCYDNLAIEKVYNFYGLTETGVENFYHECSRSDLETYREKGFIPIGTPLRGNDVKITDEKELLLAGCQITPGYLKGIGSDRFEDIDGKRWYYTGDIIEKSGDVYFCKGRLDSQVKLNGYRVELMDIEAHVKNCPGIKEAVCFVDSSKITNLLVCAYEPFQNAKIDIIATKNTLSKDMPGHMVPKKFMLLDDMPRNTNGKLDRKRIKEIYVNGLLTMEVNNAAAK